MLNVELSIGSHGGYAVVALCGGLDLADASAVAPHLTAASTGERTEAGLEKRWRHLPGCPAAPCSTGAGDNRPDRRFPGVSERGQGHKGREIVRPPSAAAS